MILNWITSFASLELLHVYPREVLLMYHFCHLWNLLWCLLDFFTQRYPHLGSKTKCLGPCYTQKVFQLRNWVILLLCYVSSTLEYQCLFIHFKAYQVHHLQSFQGVCPIFLLSMVKLFRPLLLTKMLFKILDWSFKRFMTQSCYLLKSLISLKLLKKTLSFALKFVLKFFEMLLN